MAGPAITAKLGLDASDMKKGLEEAKRDVQRTSAAVAGIGTAGAAGMVAAAAGTALFAKSLSDAGAKAELMQASFETMLGSASAAQKLRSEIADLATSTPYEGKELEGASKSLLAFGVNASDVVPTLRRLGDVAKGIDAPIGEIAEIFGKARVQGRLFQEDINQLTGRGIPVIQELAKQFGVSDSEVKKLVESGQVGFKNLEQAMVSMTSEGGKFFGMMDRMSKTTAGSLSNLSDAWTKLKTTMGNSLNVIVKPAADYLADKLKGANAIIEVLTNANNEERGLAQRLYRFTNGASGGGLSTEEGKKGLADAQADRAKRMEEEADEKTKLAEETAKKVAQTESEAASAAFIMWQEREQARTSEADDNAKKRSENEKRYAKEAHEEFSRLEDEKADRIEQNERAAYAAHLQREADKAKAMEKAAEDRQAAKDAFIEGKMDGPDAARDAARNKRKRERLGRQFEEHERSKARGFRSKADSRDNLDPMNFVPRGQRVVPGITEKDGKGVIQLAPETMQAFQALIGGLTLFTVK